MSVLYGETLSKNASDPEAHDITPGWIARNRSVIERGIKLGQLAMLVAPPPARIALAAASVAAEAVILADDVKRRLKDPGEGVVTAGLLATEGAALLAMSRFAPARLAASLAGIEGVRSALQNLASKRGAL